LRNSTGKPLACQSVAVSCARFVELVFHFADQAGLPLLDLKDLRAVISSSDQNSKDTLEQVLFGQVCAGRVGLDEARRAIGPLTLHSP
jgi:Bacterial protein of unknown function (DUF853)